MIDACTPDWLASHVPGARELIEWFGYWPSFHDAEVTCIALMRSGPSRISVHTFEPTNELNHRGQYICRKHVIVEFLLDGIRSLNLKCFNHQNAYALELEGCSGVEGALTAESVQIKLTPGPPPDSQYLRQATP